MDHRSQPLQSVVAVPTGDYVISAHVTSQSHILPRVETGDVSPPNIPRCRDRHIIRMPDAVVVVEVAARMSVYPRTLSRAAVEVSVRDGILDMLEQDNIAPTPEAYAQGLRAMTQRLVHRMRQCGVEIT